MRVLIACEFSGIVRDAFTQLGHDAVSCDLLPSERPGAHIVGNVLDQLAKPWDLVVAFPPCTYLCCTGNRWYAGTPQREAGLGFVRQLMAWPGRLALENPVGVISTRIRKPDQIVQPWQFGHAETKATCLWLREVPRLVPTDVVPGPYHPRSWLAPDVPDQWKLRSRTLPGIAQAMAAQWGTLGPASYSL